MKPKLPLKGNSSDEFGTPEFAVNPLIKYLEKSWTIWEPCATKSGIVDGLKKYGFKVIGTVSDFLHSDIECDAIVTNPPYTKKEEFLERAYSIGKPFAFLMPLTALEGQKRQALYKKYGVQLIVPDHRINFLTPSGEGSGSWFATAWFTWKIIDKDLVFETLEEQVDLKEFF